MDYRMDYLFRRLPLIYIYIYMNVFIYYLRYCMYIVTLRKIIMYTYIAGPQ